MSEMETKIEMTEVINEEVVETELLQLKIKDLEEELAKKESLLLTSLADIENLRKRTDKEKIIAHKFAVEKFAYDLLEVVDNLERCLNGQDLNEELKGVHEGVELTLKSMLGVLGQHGIKVMTSLNEPFDPQQHNAVSMREIEGVGAGIVVEVIQKGYWLKERVLRPASVVVSK